MKRARVAGRSGVAGASHGEGRRRLVLLLVLSLVAAGLWARIPLRGRWLERQSLEALAAYVSSHPAETDAALLLSERYLAAQNAPQAEEVLQRLLEREPGSGRAWLLRSDAELAQGKLRSAYASLQVVLPLLAQKAEAYWRLGLILERQGDEAGAEAEFRRALEHDPGHVGARLELARAALAHRHYGPALEHLEVAIQREPRNGTALEALALTHRNLGHLDQAETYAREAVRQAPGSGGAWRALAQVLKDRATEPALREAEQTYRRALELMPDSSELHHELGMIYFSRGDHARAAEELQRAIDLHPLNRQPYPALIQCYRRLGREDKAGRLSAEFRKVNEMDLSTAPLEYSIYAMPQNTALRMKLARLYVRYGRPDLALTQVEHVLELNPGHAEAQRLRAELQAQAK